MSYPCPSMTYQCPSMTYSCQSMSFPCLFALPCPNIVQNSPKGCLLASIAFMSIRADDLTDWRQRQYHCWQYRKYLAISIVQNSLTMLNYCSFSIHSRQSVFSLSLSLPFPLLNDSHESVNPLSTFEKKLWLFYAANAGDIIADFWIKFSSLPSLSRLFKK